jgi:hypothetical protein
LGVPLIDEAQLAPDFARLQLPAPDAWKWIGRVSRLCNTVGVAAAVYALILWSSQAWFDRLHAEAVPVRARLIATTVEEGTEGRGNWTATGRFEIEFPDRGRVARGNLIPSGERGNRHRKLTKAEAASHLSAWKVGDVYQAYQYPDHPEWVFFELMGAEENARTVLQFGGAAAALLAVGIVLGQAHQRLQPASAPIEQSTQMPIHRV